MIIMLGQGLLYRLHHEKAQMLTQMEKKRALKLLTGIVGCIAIIIITTCHYLT
jgi:hypothetical protein